MLPKLVAQAGYSDRSVERATFSSPFSPVYGPTSTDSSFSSAPNHSTLDLGLTWSLLDYGVGQYNARQQADRVLIAAEKRRKAMHLLMQDVRTAYWRAASAQQLRDDVTRTITLFTPAPRGSARPIRCWSFPLCLLRSKQAFSFSWMARPPFCCGTKTATVNEGSPYAVFTVTGTPGQATYLSLDNEQTTGLERLEYYDPNSTDANANGWVLYTSGTVNLDANGELLVRVAIDPEQEAMLDSPETFRLIATNVNGIESAFDAGIGTILDDGTGDYFADDNTDGVSVVPEGISLDDDSPGMTIVPVTVEEGSTAVFNVKVTAAEAPYTVTFATSLSSQSLVVASQLARGVHWLLQPTSTARSAVGPAP